MINTRRDDAAFILKYVQPGLMGLMDGSVSTMAPIFAAAFATHDSHIAFVIGMAAAVGSGISMAFAEALSDTGHITGRGHAYVRGFVVGFMTLIGGVFHTLPFLIPDVSLALNITYVVVALELIAIAWIRFHYFRLPFSLSVVQVVIGGLLVIAAGLLIGSA